MVKLITARGADQPARIERHDRGGARGEAGKGFAVVAQEVKALAVETTKATGEIDRHIAGVQAATQASVLAIKEIGETINRISRSPPRSRPRWSEQEATI